MNDEMLTNGIIEFNRQRYPLANNYFKLSNTTNHNYYYYYGLSSYYTKDYAKAVDCLYQLNNEASVSEVLIESFLRLNDLDNIVKLYRLSNIDDYINGLTLLFRSVRYRIFQMIERLLKYGANPHKTCDNPFKTPYNYALIYGDIDLLLMLYK